MPNSERERYVERYLAEIESVKKTRQFLKELESTCKAQPPFDSLNHYLSTNTLYRRDLEEIMNMLGSSTAKLRPYDGYLLNLEKKNQLFMKMLQQKENVSETLINEIAYNSDCTSEVINIILTEFSSKIDSRLLQSILSKKNTNFIQKARITSDMISKILDDFSTKIDARVLLVILKNVNTTSDLISKILDDFSTQIDPRVLLAMLENANITSDLISKILDDFRTKIDPRVLLAMLENANITSDLIGKILSNLNNFNNILHDFESFEELLLEILKNKHTNSEYIDMILNNFKSQISHQILHVILKHKDSNSAHIGLILNNLQLYRLYDFLYSRVLDDILMHKNITSEHIEFILANFASELNTTESLKIILTKKHNITLQEIEFLIGRERVDSCKGKLLLCLLENKTIPQDDLKKLITSSFKEFLIAFISELRRPSIIFKDEDTKKFYIDRFLKIIKEISFSGLDDKEGKHIKFNKVKFKDIKDIFLSEFKEINIKDCVFIALIFIANSDYYELVHQAFSLVKHIYDEKDKVKVAVMQQAFIKFIPEDFKKYNEEQALVLRTLVGGILPQTQDNPLPLRQLRQYNKVYPETQPLLKDDASKSTPQSTSSIATLSSGPLSIIAQYSGLEPNFANVVKEPPLWKKAMGTFIPIKNVSTLVPTTFDQTIKVIEEVKNEGVKKRTKQ